MKSNAEVLKMICLENTELALSIKKKKLAYYGHARRHYSLHKLVLEGKLGGKRGRGRRRKTWTGNVSEMTKMSKMVAFVVWRSSIEFYTVDRLSPLLRIVRKSSCKFLRLLNCIAEI